jgi:hypothetical protein
MISGCYDNITDEIKTHKSHRNSVFTSFRGRLARPVSQPSPTGLSDHDDQFSPDFRREPLQNTYFAHSQNFFPFVPVTFETSI